MSRAPRFGGLLWLLLAPLPCLAPPRWISIATPSEPYQYFLYAGNRRVENARFSPKNPHPSPEFSYHFVAGRGGRTVCQLTDRPDVHWFSPGGRPLNGTFPAANASEFTVSALQSPMQGFGATAAFSGSAAHRGAMEIVYFTDRPCSDAGNEYGFSRDLADNNVLVYWSAYANCSNDESSLCRKTNDPALGPDYSNVQQENGGARAEHGFRLYGLDLKRVYTYKIFIHQRRLRVEVWNGGQLAECSDSPGGPRAPCSLSRQVQPWFPIDQLRAGYVVAGTQNDDASGVPPDTVFKVSDILVLK